MRGLLYDLGTYPAAKPCIENNFIIGELYQVRNEKEFAWAIGQLDDYEGVTVAFDEMQLYRREVAEVQINNKTTHAWMYWYNGSIEGKPVIKSGDVLEYMEQKK